MAFNDTNFCNEPDGFYTAAAKMPALGTCMVNPPCESLCPACGGDTGEAMKRMLDGLSKPQGSGLFPPSTSAGGSVMDYADMWRDLTRGLEQQHATALFMLREGDLTKKGRVKWEAKRDALREAIDMAALVEANARDHAAMLTAIMPKGGE